MSHPARLWHLPYPPSPCPNKALPGRLTRLYPGRPVLLYGVMHLRTTLVHLCFPHRLKKLYNIKKNACWFLNLPTFFFSCLFFTAPCGSGMFPLFPVPRPFSDPSAGCRRCSSPVPGIPSFRGDSFRVYLFRGDSFRVYLFRGDSFRVDLFRDDLFQVDSPVQQIPGGRAVDYNHYKR